MRATHGRVVSKATVATCREVASTWPIAATTVVGIVVTVGPRVAGWPLVLLKTSAKILGAWLEGSLVEVVALAEEISFDFGLVSAANIGAACK